MRVAVVGGGASGTLVATHLARQAGATGSDLDIVLIDPSTVGQGLAYSTGDDRHRLNVPASGMSAWPGDPLHFVRWLRATVDPRYPECAFAPRPLFARYLSETLGATVAAAPGVHFEHLSDRVVDAHQTDPGARLRLADGRDLHADAIVLALGHGRPSPTWAPRALRTSRRFVADPWLPQDQPELPRGATVLLIGTGLTMVDMAMRYDGATVHAVSRHGMLPLAHAIRPGNCAPAQLPHEALTRQATRRLVFDLIRRFEGDWRMAIDSLRPVTAAIWSSWSDDERAAFFDYGLRRWDRARHRIDPEVDAWLTARRATGDLILHAGTVTAAREDPNTIEVSLSDGTVVAADLVVNCTGTCAAIGTIDDPLVTELLTSGTARLGPLGLGFATDGTGRLVPSDGLPAWTLGPLRRGELFETTAIPEIRCQAQQIASAILATARVPA